MNDPMCRVRGSSNIRQHNGSHQYCQKRYPNPCKNDNPAPMPLSFYVRQAYMARPAVSSGFTAISAPGIKPARANLAVDILLSPGPLSFRCGNHPIPEVECGYNLSTSTRHSGGDDGGVDGGGGSGSGGGVRSTASPLLRVVSTERGRRLQPASAAADVEGARGGVDEGKCRRDRRRLQLGEREGALISGGMGRTRKEEEEREEKGRYGDGPGAWRERGVTRKEHEEQRGGQSVGRSTHAREDASVRKGIAAAAAADPSIGVGVLSGAETEVSPFVRCREDDSRRDNVSDGPVASRDGSVAARARTVARKMSENDHPTSSSGRVWVFHNLMAKRGFERQRLPGVAGWLANSSLALLAPDIFFSLAEPAQPPSFFSADHLQKRGRTSDDGTGKAAVGTNYIAGSSSSSRTGSSGGGGFYSVLPMNALGGGRRDPGIPEVDTGAEVAPLRNPAATMGGGSGVDGANEEKEEGKEEEEEERLLVFSFYRAFDGESGSPVAHAEGNASSLAAAASVLLLLGDGPEGGNDFPPITHATL